ncbi:binding-protein-dependent transporters inner membrane component [Paenibacillus alvei TS-15]|uniref:Binding-protein-dependent transporters inner membrane component n=3 Tax=Paenibacillus TaxID=44249 RepID=A0A383RDN0_PAEAL|nr:MULTISPECIES: carbohydrate ABC transporter permease [Paenibacillus]EPY03619.1 binding-protein-dependent transporters inner membrane component [Paenibacillus alvei TS-15]EPY12150.1 binding-protein-dependent transporters inner membrane component [Paenibacillus alvei A6-6i-x]MCM3291397.1 carbohydrate ABC transporter permease [Paenibacillus sp. MER 180]MCY9533184.1 carbohydrate ABC transporter permease [Paenibacillus alvei]MDT8975646.1 carbohydrate ABC transporter permease [Paenibacillus sp. ch
MLTLRNKITKIIATVLMGALSILFIFPLLWMVSSAFKFEKDVMRFPIEWIPSATNFVNNFKAVWMQKVPFGQIYFNSIKVAIIVTLLSLLISTMAAYSFTKLQFRGRNLVFAGLLAMMIIPDQATLIPRFMLIRWLGLYDTHAALILMGMFSIYFTFLLRQFMAGVSDDILEAAKIDGAGHLRSFTSIMLPLCQPVIATVAIIKFIWSWNDYQNPLIFLQSKSLYTVPLGMTLFRDDYTTNDAIMMMAAVSAIIPLLIVFIVLQRQVISGIALGGVKG